MDDVYYIICGVGSEENTLRELCKYFSDRVHFLGYRTDVKELLSASDIFVMPSLCEGLSRSLMEAMASGLPCVVSNIRGNVDLIDNNGGYLTSSVESVRKSISELRNVCLCNKISVNNEEIVKKFSIKIIIDDIKQIYSSVFE